MVTAQPLRPIARLLELRIVAARQLHPRKVESTLMEMAGALELLGFCQLRIFAQLKLEGSTAMATAMNLVAMERSTAMVMAIKGSMGTAMVMEIEGLTVMESSMATAMAMNLMAMKGLMAMGQRWRA
jgi:hypothetical protein